MSEERVGYRHGGVEADRAGQAGLALLAGATGLVRDLLREVEVRKPAIFRDLAICGLVASPGLRGTPAGPLAPAGIDYVTLDEALGKDWFTVEELSQQGSVPELRIHHRGVAPVLILDGEELIGAKQNRILNTTVIIMPGQETVIPVSCVEAGRWSYSSRRFRSGGTALYGSLRARKAAQVDHSVRTGMGFRADQGAIWNDIAEMSSSLGVASSTGAMHDVYEEHGATLEEYLEALVPEEDWSGAVFFVGDELAGAEFLPTPDLLRREWRKLVLSHAMDALRTRGGRDGQGGCPDYAAGAGAQGVMAEPAYRERAQRFLADAAGAEFTEHPSVGAGIDVRIRGQGVVGSALVHERQVAQVAHVVLFSQSS